MIKFFVAGVPQPKGSAKAFYIKSLSRAVVTQDNAAKQKPWASSISYLTQRNMDGQTRFTACNIDISFVMPRPKKHFGAKGLKANFLLAHHLTKPDIDKLVRCVLDALKQGGAFEDDSRVVSIRAEKKYGMQTGATICLSESM